MNRKNASPTIEKISWGKIIVEDLGVFRDAKLYPGGGRKWDWRETDTHHTPGIQPADVQELIDNGSEFIVLSRGMELALQTCPETVEKLDELSIPHVIEETKKAVETYNSKVAAGIAVGGLFHSTC